MTGLGRLLTYPHTFQLQPDSCTHAPFGETRSEASETKSQVSDDLDERSEDAPTLQQLQESTKNGDFSNVVARAVELRQAGQARKSLYWGALDCRPPGGTIAADNDRAEDLCSEEVLESLPRKAEMEGVQGLLAYLEAIVNNVTKEFAALDDGDGSKTVSELQRMMEAIDPSDVHLVWVVQRLKDWLDKDAEPSSKSTERTFDLFNVGGFAKLPGSVKLR
ncbi:hypothetical protein HK104_006700 [Borealophlyctis nickersoniae]|nr:hypothetical protein HK104_006700 [Borealophlyctis nickersoniae]